jgi:carboxypeptidase family protein
MADGAGESAQPTPVIRTKRLPVRESHRIAKCIGSVLSVVALHGAAAQTATGSITDSVSHQPIRGAIVFGLDASGASLGRTLSNGNGYYRLALGAGVRRVRVVHIGFRPRIVPLPPGDSAIARLDISLAPLPTMLEPVRATEAARCPRRSNPAAALALWDQARTGLLATIVAREVDAPQVKRLHFERAMDGNSERIASQSVYVDSLPASSRPFAAVRSGADFARLGFRAADGETFLAPDADVLLDDAFAEAYCFALASVPTSRPHAAGLEFFAAQHVDGRTDIRGILWIDTLTRRLSDLEFHYVGFKRAIESRHPGGMVSFEEMPNGTVLIDRWYLRLVGSRSDATTSDESADLPPSVSGEIVVHEVGGELARATWTDGSQWRAPLGTVRGVLTRDGKAVRTGVRVALHNTSYATATDSLGRFEIRDLLPGPYRMYVSDPELAAFGFVEDTTVTFIAARDSVVSGPFAVASLDDYLAASCRIPIESARHADALLGHALTATGRRAANVRVKFLTSAPVPTTRYFPPGSLKTEYLTGTDGAFAFCHPPFDGAISLLPVYRGAPGETLTRQTTPDARLVLVDLPVDTTLAPARPPR